MRTAKNQILFDQGQVEAMIGEMARDLLRRHPAMGSLALVGIRTGGVYVAERMAKYMAAETGAQPDLGVMDITLYRDDWTLAHQRPKLGPTKIDFPVGGRVVVLVDDVLFTGRTIRAAMDALIDFGRPLRVELAVLVDRGGRELPIQPDYVGVVAEAAKGEVIDVLMSESGASTDQVVLRTL